MLNRANMTGITLGVLLSLGAAASAHQSGVAGKKVIEWGYDQPTDVQVQKNIAQMEQEPFDGIVLGALGWTTTRRIDLFKSAWGAEAFTREEFQPAVDHLKATPFHRFTDNFLRLNVTPGNVDWFDDNGWKAIVSNAALASWICREGGLKGIMFDTEQYDSKVFYYQAQPGKAQHSFEEYRDEARKRGREYGKALTSEKADATIFLSYATSVFTLQKQNPLAWSEVGLLPAFIDGMLEAADSRAVFVDGLETAYALKKRSQFVEMKKGAREAKNHSQVPDKYDARVTDGFGLWLDYNGKSPQNHWDANDVTTNYFKPDEFKKVLHTALTLSDKYVWIYSQQINWWSGKGISKPYVDAVQAAKQQD